MTRNDIEAAKMIKDAQLRYVRIMADIRRALPEVGTGATATALAEEVRRQLAALPPARRRLIKTRIALAISDLTALDAFLSRAARLLGDDLRKMYLHRAAARAYGRGTAVRHSRQRRH